MFEYNGFGAIIEDFQDANAGSLLLIVSVGGGVGVTVEGDLGLAVDMDFLAFSYKQYLSNKTGFGESSVDEFSGAVGSLFTAAGFQMGPAAGGGVDFSVGYHVANPDGVGGPGLDLSLEVKAKAGAGFGVGIDISQAPWQIVTAGVGVGAGIEVKFASGPSYAVVIGQLCGNGELTALVRDCPLKTTSVSTNNSTETGYEQYAYGSKIWGGGGGSAFDDLLTLTEEDNLSITKIYLHTGARVDKIGLEFSNGVQVRHGGDGGSATPLVVPSGTTLQKVKVCKSASHTSMRVHYIKLTLSDGSSVSGGTETGDCVTLKHGNGYPIVGFRGFSGNELDSLGVIYDKKAGSL